MEPPCDSDILFLGIYLEDSDLLQRHIVIYVHCSSILNRQEIWVKLYINRWIYSENDHTYGWWKFYPSAKKIRLWIVHANCGTGK